jgi:facilitated trehalose transporter
MLTAWGLGYFLNWRISAYTLVIPPILLTFFAFILPETPYWLIEKGKIEEAKKSLQFVRGAKYDITDELSEIIRGNHAKSEKSDISSLKASLIQKLIWIIYITMQEVVKI